MSVARWFRKKPVMIQAIQITGRNDDEVKSFLGSAGFDPVARHPSFIIHTLEGDMEAQRGDWIVRGIKGEYYPVKPDIFEATYEGC